MQLWFAGQVPSTAQHSTPGCASLGASCCRCGLLTLTPSDALCAGGGAANTRTLWRTPWPTLLHSQELRLIPAPHLPPSLQGTPLRRQGPPPLPPLPPPLPPPASSSLSTPCYLKALGNTFPHHRRVWTGPGSAGRGSGDGRVGAGGCRLVGRRPVHQR